MKKFAIYCSGNATIPLLMYSKELFNNHCKPTAIIYDGNSKLILKQLSEYCKLTLHSSKTSKSISDLIYRILKQNNIEFLFCFGSKILNGNLLIEYKNKLINFHPSLLPSFKGKNAIDQALKENCLILGNSAHYMIEEIDSGKLICQTAMSINNYKDYISLIELQLPMFLKILSELLNYKIKNTKIKNSIKNKNYIIGYYEK